MESHLLQMRGLKRIRVIAPTKNHTSHLLQMRGLKPSTWTNVRPASFIVASFTDAWIETISWWHCEKTPAVASFTDAWIETPHPQLFQYSHCRIFYRCVD